MSMLRKGDDELHYSDNSHRWIAPPDVDQRVWEADLRNHLSEHRATMGGPAHLDDAPVCRPRRVPRQVTPLPKKKMPARHAANGGGTVVPVPVPRPELPKHVKDRSARPLPGAA